jgi:hypothetical protein
MANTLTKVRTERQSYTGPIKAVTAWIRIMRIEGYSLIDQEFTRDGLITANMMRPKQ